MEKVTQTEDKKVIAGKRLRECRKKLNLTQEMLAEKIGELPENNGKDRSDKHIGYMERGLREISPEYARLLGKVLGVLPEYFLLEVDYATEAEHFADVINAMNNEGDLLYTGLSAFALLNQFEITPPQTKGTGSLENYFRAVKKGYTISKGEQAVSLSVEEMNRFENEVCDFVELKLKHLFKQKGVDL